MKRSLFLVLCISLIAAFASCAAPAAKGSKTGGQFDYNARLPFDTKIVSETERDGVQVIDLNYAAHDPSFSPMTGGRTLAYLVRPLGDGPFAGVIYLHWQASNRNQFLDEAVSLAGHGAVCLVLQGYFPWMAQPTGTETDRQQIIGQVTELRRAIDFLLAQPGVDPKRIAFVGHDYGAIYGGILSGVDHRVADYVLTAGAPSFSDWIGFNNVAPEKYLQLVGDLDPIHYVPLAAPAVLFFQFGQRDGIISKDLGTSFYSAASDPKQVTWYDALHGMATDEVRQGRLDWLVTHLSLKP